MNTNNNNTFVDTRYKDYEIQKKKKIEGILSGVLFKKLVNKNYLPPSMTLVSILARETETPRLKIKAILAILLDMLWVQLSKKEGVVLRNIGILKLRKVSDTKMCTYFPTMQRALVRNSWILKVTMSSKFKNHIRKKYGYDLELL